MPLAAPLILPFAELAGITIAGLGMAAASKKVSDFISDNPETSTQILTMLVPGGQGLNALFKKEAGITLEDVEDMTDEEAADLSKEDKAEIMKEVGKSKGGDKRQRMIEISEKLGLSGEGKEKQTIIDEVEERYDEGGVEDAPKPKFDYKKFFRNRNADGGAIGIEVLFEEKKDGGRIGYQSGGGLMDIETEFGLQAPKGTISFDDYLGGLYNSDKVGALQNLAVKDYAQGDYTKTATGPISDFRHQAAMNELSKSFSPGLVPNIIGDTIAFGAGLINEIPALGRGVNRENLREIGEDIVSNFKGTYGTSNKRTPEEIYDSIFNPRTTVVSSPNLTYGTAAAADFRDGKMLQTPTRTNVQGRDLEADLGTRINPNIQPQQNIFQRVGDVAQKGIGFLKDSPGMLLSAASGIPFAGSILSGLGNMFEYRGGMGYVDEDGVFRSADELDKLNARGGYYTDAARASRRRDRSIRNMLARQAAGKRIGENRLAALQEQQAKEEAARQAAFDAIMSSQQSQQDFYDSLNQGRGATSTAESRATAGDAPGYSGPSPFAKGGIATMFVEKR